MNADILTVVMAAPTSFEEELLRLSVEGLQQRLAELEGEGRRLEQEIQAQETHHAAKRIKYSARFVAPSYHDDLRVLESRHRCCG